MRMSFVAKARSAYYSPALGWQPEHHPTFDPGHGYVVAHDVLEHNPKDPDSIQTELMAIGAGAYVKGENKQMDWVSSIGNDSYSFSQGKRISEPPFVAAEFDADTTKLFDYAWLSFKATRMLEAPRIADADIERQVRGWWKVGYFAAKKRYKDISQTELFAAHKFIMEHADTMRAQANPGARLLVTVNKVWTGGIRKLAITMYHMGVAGTVLDKKTNRLLTAKK